MQSLLKEIVPFTVKLGLVVVVGLICFVIAIQIAFASYSNVIPSSSKEMPVSGTAKKKVNPDSAQITLGKNVRGNNIGELQTKAATNVNTLTTKLKELGVKDEQMKTSNYNLTPVYNKDNDITSYSINISVDVTLEKINPQDELIGKIINAGTAAGIDEVRNLNFYLADYNKVARELEDEAVADAKSLAQKRASSVGATLGRVIRVDFGGSFPYYYGREMAASAPAATDSAKSSLDIKAGQVDLQTTVTVVYELR
jgi:uncharacterized protein